VAMQLQDPTSGWPTPTLNTIYILYTPPSTSITSGGVVTQCPTQGGAHGLFPGADNPNVPVALVIGSCAWTEQEDSDTTDASLLLADSATDPGNQAWNGYDQAHFAWELYADGLSEIGGACSLYAEDYFRPGIDLPYAVGRFWSNASAKEGHDPCVPAVPGAYYNATPLGMTAIDVNVGGNGVPSQQVRTRGYRIPPGQTRTFQVGLYSDAPTSAWDVQAVEGDGVVPPPGPILEISTDKSGGNNGDEINVTVKVRRTPAGQTGVLMTVLSTQNQLQHAVPILIGTY